MVAIGYDILQKLMEGKSITTDPERSIVWYLKNGYLYVFTDGVESISALGVNELLSTQFFVIE